MSLESLKTKVGLLIEKAQSGGGGLPDWDDDSPVIARGSGLYAWIVWELTEKGTMRWKIDKTHPNYNPDNSKTYWAGWTGNALEYIKADFLEVADKVRQIYIDDEFQEIVLGQMPNCERIRIPEKAMKTIGLRAMPSLKELNFIDDGKTIINLDTCSSLEKITLSPLRSKMIQVSSLAKLKEINLENITQFPDLCFITCPILNKDLVCSPNLTKIGGKVFQNTSIKSVKFQNSIDNLPTLTTGSFLGAIGLKNIYCPWAEGAVANAPWGASNATIHYNYNAEV